MKRTKLSRKTPLQLQSKLRAVSRRKQTRAVDGVLYLDGNREVCSRNQAGRDEYRRRTMVCAERQGYLCALCGGQLRGDITYDHSDGRTAGRKDERLEIDGKHNGAAVHSACNRKAGSIRHHWTHNNTQYEPLRGNND